jgi:hypothetical protein
MLMTNDGPLSPMAGDDDPGPGLPPALSGRQLRERLADDTWLK